MGGRGWRSVYASTAVLFAFAAVKLADWLGDRGHKAAHRSVVGVPFPMAGWGGPDRAGANDPGWFSTAGACLNAAVALAAAGAVVWAVRQPAGQRGESA